MIRVNSTTGIWNFSERFYEIEYIENSTLCILKRKNDKKELMKLVSLGIDYDYDKNIRIEIYAEI